MATDLEICSQLCTTEFHEKKCPIAKKLRDCWTTPKDLVDRLPMFGLDPCSNPRAHLIAERQLCLERGENGLEEDWSEYDSVFVNGPYSNLRPFARKAATARAFVFLVNLDPSTKWWKELVRSGGRYRFEFDKRLKFEPPPRIKESTNNKPSALVCNWAGALMVERGLRGLGKWWVNRDAEDLATLGPSVDGR